MNNTYSESRQPLFVNLRDLVNKYLPKLHVDKTFQRRVCWSPQQKQKFIISLLKQHEAGTFSFADVKTGIERSEADGDDASLKKYETVKNLLKELISLDAQNRGIAAQDYYNNKFGITTGIILDGEKYELEDCLYKDLPIMLKAHLDNAKMIVIIFEYFLYSSLNQIFLSINDGLPMVDQEKRNSIASWISTQILVDAETKYSKVLQRVVKPEDILRMGDVELLVKVLIATHKVFDRSSTGAKVLDSFYELGSGKTRNQVAEYQDKHMDRFYKIMNHVKQILNAPKHKNLQSLTGGLPNQTFWATVLIAEYLVDSAQSIKTGSTVDLDVAIYDLEKKLVARAEQSRTAAQVLYQNGAGPEPNKRDYYDSWIGLPHQQVILQKRKKELTEAFQKEYANILVSKVAPISKAVSNG